MFHFINHSSVLQQIDNSEGFIVVSRQDFNKQMMTGDVEIFRVLQPWLFLGRISFESKFYVSILVKRFYFKFNQYV